MSHRIEDRNFLRELLCRALLPARASALFAPVAPSEA